MYIRIPNWEHPSAPAVNITTTAAAEPQGEDTILAAAEVTTAAPPELSATAQVPAATGVPVHPPAPVRPQALHPAARAAQRR